MKKVNITDKELNAIKRVLDSVEEHMGYVEGDSPYKKDCKIVRRFIDKVEKPTIYADKKQTKAREILIKGDK